MKNLRLLADSLANGLALVTWTPTTTTVHRKNWVTVDVADMANPVIYVTPGGAEVTRVNRGNSQIDYTVNVFIGRQVETDADVDAMIDLASAVVLRLRAHQWFNIFEWPNDATSPMTVTIDVDPDDALNERNVWRAVIVATYRMFEADAVPE